MESDLELQVTNFYLRSLHGFILASYHIVEEAAGVLPIRTGDQYQSPIKLRIIINKEFHVDFNLPAFNTNIVGIEKQQGWVSTHLKYFLFMYWEVSVYKDFSMYKNIKELLYIQAVFRVMN